MANLKEPERNVGYDKQRQRPIPTINVDYLPDTPLMKQAESQPRYRNVRPDYLSGNPNDNG